LLPHIINGGTMIGLGIYGWFNHLSIYIGKSGSCIIFAFIGLIAAFIISYFFEKYRINSKKVNFLLKYREKILFTISDCFTLIEQDFYSLRFLLKKDDYKKIKIEPLLNDLNDCIKLTIEDNLLRELLKDFKQWFSNCLYVIENHNEYDTDIKNNFFSDLINCKDKILKYLK
jgi:hypothetical protein